MHRESYKEMSLPLTGQVNYVIVVRPMNVACTGVVGNRDVTLHTPLDPFGRVAASHGRSRNTEIGTNSFTVLQGGNNSIKRSNLTFGKVYIYILELVLYVLGVLKMS